MPENVMVIVSDRNSEYNTQVLMGLDYDLSSVKV